MKKFFFIFVVLLCTMTMAFGQMTNPEILEMIQKSKEYNQQNAGVLNPDLVYPGQTLTYFFQDGAVEVITVETGDNQWVIVRDKLTKLREKHGEIVDHVQPDPQIQPKPSVVVQPEPFPWWTNVPWGWILALIAVMVIVAKLLQIRYKNRRRNPVTAGEAQIPGGVRDSGAYSRMRQVAQNQFPGSRLDIRNIRRGKLSGLATVHYASGKPKKLRLKKTPAYAGEVVVNGNTQTIYFLQGCGNDARQGNFMSGNLVFEPDVMIAEDGSENPLPTPVAPVIESIVEQHAPIVSEVVRSEYDGQVKRAMELAEKVIAKDQSHEVSIEIPKGEGTFKVVFKAQYPLKEKKS